MYITIISKKNKWSYYLQLVRAPTFFPHSPTKKEKKNPEIF